MKKFLVFFLALFSFISNNAQGFGDTITVQTLEFSDITKRRGWYVFPSDTNQYHKILMLYTLKCDPATTQDNFNCGEWDYTTYTNLYQHKNLNTPYYFLQNSNPDTIYYNTNPKYDVFNSYDTFIVYDTVFSEDSLILGQGSSSTSDVFNTLGKSGKAQYLISAAELNSIGLSAGSIDKLALKVESLGKSLDHVVIRMKNSSLSQLSSASYEVDSLTQVYNSFTKNLTIGYNTFNFTNPFVWDGVSNVVVELSFTNQATGFSNYSLSADNLSNSSGIYMPQDACLDFEGDDIVDVPSSVFSNVDSAITISFWCFGDPNLMPFNSYIFEGRDANGYRVVNCHLPWSNSRVYWDAGNSGTSSYDRVDQSASATDFSGKWNHWAFTKDASTGEMKAFLNGDLFMSATGKTRLMDGITSFRIGGTASSGFNGVYDGKINEFRIWDSALDQSTIQSWMFRSLDNSHPNFSSLLAAYSFDEASGITANSSFTNGSIAQLMGLPSWEVSQGKDLFLNPTPTNIRPKFIFTQGVYSSHLDSNLVSDTIYYDPISIVETQPYIDMNSSGISSTMVDTIFGYESGWGFTYNHLGIAIDSTNFSIDNTLINSYKQVTHQLQNYVTPYGIGLDLGPNGFRWVYDVTDYMLLFNDTIEISAGNQQELIDLKFMMVKGIPPRDVVDFETIWRGDYSHANIANDVSLPAVDILMNPNASHFKVKTRTTGHWFGGFQNCAEFCPKLHNLSVNGTQQFEWLNWKECADNPVIAQGGTWIYDRAGWCPGTFGDTYDHDITPFVTPGTTASIDYGMEVTSGGMEGNYRTTVQLVSYGDYNFQNDVGVIDVMAPNNWEYHNRYNPICDNPKIVIQNNGEQPITSAEIHYWICGGPHEIYNWTGNLAFGESVEVELPIVNPSFWDHAYYCQKFTTVVTKANGVADDYPANNAYTVAFDVPPMYQSDLIIWTSTNNAAYENELYIKDDQGNVVFSRTNFQNATLYRDTVNLDPGCYRLEFLDSDEDGISFFANNDGNGSFRIKAVGGPTLEIFEGDFGKDIIHYFTVGYALDVDDRTNAILNVSPNPSDGLFVVDVDGFAVGVELTLFDSFGKLVLKENISATDYPFKKSIDLSQLSNGVYLLKASDGAKEKFTKLIKN